MRLFHTPELLPWETDWVREMIGTAFANRLEPFNSNDGAQLDDTVLIVSVAAAYRPFIARLIAAGKRFGVILFSDEGLQDKSEYIDHPLCAFVARNYLHPATFRHSKSITFGLGYKQGFRVVPATLTAAKLRPHIWSFMGSMHGPDRIAAVEAFRNLPPHFFHPTSHFNAPDYLGVSEYQRVMEASQFALCPRGHINLDTFRIYEALEAGSVPVTLARAPHLDARPTYWHCLFETQEAPPFVIADSWEQARETVERILAKDALDKMQRACGLFWAQWKSIWRFRIQRRLLEMD
jgi:hypothetical protein